MLLKDLPGGLANCDSRIRVGFSFNQSFSAFALHRYVNKIGFKHDGIIAEVTPQESEQSALEVGMHLVTDDARLTPRVIATMEGGVVVPFRRHCSFTVRLSAGTNVHRSKLITALFARASRKG
jgi:hypothetical protein